MTVPPASSPPLPADAAARWRRMLSTRLYRNRKAVVHREDASGCRIEVPNQRLKGLVPPVSWIIKPRPTRTVELDPLGSRIFMLCRDNTTVETVVDAFAKQMDLTFHESRVSVSQYIRYLVERGLLVLAVKEEVDHA